MYILYLAKVAGEYIFSVMMSRFRRMSLIRVAKSLSSGRLPSVCSHGLTMCVNVNLNAANNPRKLSKKISCSVTEVSRVALPRETTSPADISKISSQ
ncbi:PREDICTED: uncharacterized protein LOC109486826 [Branchiostoma belcheri]|uniref:Uncharacterized protein LOC109486826 n=1 Tax=Branchiostoma belcheri TaxID=7741 RepID=A0A6P5AT76_BRABE|nr:PREDICTED: uncharacterized protein LOC109486826 [Branchiostoma belcheri]